MFDWLFNEKSDYFAAVTRDKKGKHKGRCRFKIIQGTGIDENSFMVSSIEDTYDDFDAAAKVIRKVCPHIPIEDRTAD